jgi:hypothetical protein
MKAWFHRICAILLFCPAYAAVAQQTPSTQQMPTAPPAAVAGQPQPERSDQPLLKQQQLDQLVAPIALYPDPLLSNVLIASTYPLEVVQADRWLKQNQNLKGDQLKAAASQQPWDDSIKALIATPSVLDTMSSQLDWTQKLGDAVLAQQTDVMDSVQRLRARAQSSNKLTTTPQQKVTVKQDGGRQVIAIEPATPDSIYVPYYDPAVVYGAWPYSDYPPYYWGYPSYIPGAVIATGLAFGAAYGIARWNYWNNGGFGWGRGDIYAGGGARAEAWRHNAAHRGGVGYSNANVRQQFGGGNARAGDAARQNIRSGNANRAGAGNRAGNRQTTGAGNRQPSQARGAGANKQSQARNAGKKQSQARKGGGKKQSQARKGGGKQQAHARKGGARPAGARSHGRSAASHAQRAGGGRNVARQAGGRSFGGGGRSFGRAGGGGFRGGGGRGGGRRSDIELKRDVTLLGHLSNGLGVYRFRYVDGDRAYVGVIAQEVERIRPDAVSRGSDGYLRVSYDRLGFKFQTYDQWIASGARIPPTSR